MANNRIYLKCKGCGVVFYLGKRFVGGYYTNNENLYHNINDYFDKHVWCNGAGLDCFTLEYEMEPNQFP